MLEAKVESPVIIKKLLDAIKELVSDANFECNEEGLQPQMMDNSHVALVAVHLREDSFMQYRCDRAMPSGVNLASLGKVIKAPKAMTLPLSGRTMTRMSYILRTDRIAEYGMKLMDIDTDHLGIPDTEYGATVKLASAEQEDGDDEESGKNKKKAKVKKEKDVDVDGDDDMEEDDGGPIQENGHGGSDAEPGSDADEDEEAGSKKRKPSSASSSTLSASIQGGGLGGGSGITRARGGDWCRLWARPFALFTGISKR
ncbi:proliferating cell nuclear antigen [Tulasnella sp. 403]|nr:proliferating cell nuclear antigen [Tulasnella sp. 403]